LLVPHAVVTVWELFRDLRGLNLMPNPVHNDTANKFAVVEPMPMATAVDTKVSDKSATPDKVGVAQHGPVRLSDQGTAWDAQRTRIMTREPLSPMSGVTESAVVLSTVPYIPVQSPDAIKVPTSGANADDPEARELAAAHRRLHPQPRVGTGAVATSSEALTHNPLIVDATTAMVHTSRSPVITVPLRLAPIAEASSEGGVSSDVKLPSELPVVPAHFLADYQETHDKRAFEDDFQSNRVLAERYWRAWQAAGGNQSTAVTSDAVARELRRQATAQSSTLRQRVLGRRSAMHDDDDDEHLQAAIGALEDLQAEFNVSLDDSGARIEE